MSSLLYGPTLTSLRDYWENHSIDYRDLCLDWGLKQQAFILTILETRVHKQVAGRSVSAEGPLPGLQMAIFS